MSRIFKKPKTYLNQGSTEARLHKRAKLIHTQEQLDAILSQVSPQIGEEWLRLFGPHLKFVPRQLQSVQVGQPE